jgi:hypothetical protein
MNRLNDKRSTTEEAEGKGETGQPGEPHLPPRVAALNFVIEHEKAGSQQLNAARRIESAAIREAQC